MTYGRRRRLLLAICCLLFPLSLPVSAAGSQALLHAVKPEALPRSADARLTQLLVSHKGKPVLVNFWATWCQPCREEIPALHRLAQRGKATGVTVLTVAVADKAAQVDDFLWEVLPSGESLPVLHDREQLISRAWGVRMLPSSILLDRRHRIVARGLGVIDWDAPTLDQALNKLLTH